VVLLARGSLESAPLWKALFAAGCSNLNPLAAFDLINGDHLWPNVVVGKALAKELAIGSGLSESARVIYPASKKTARFF